MSAIICDFGTAPGQVDKGYNGIGQVVIGSDDNIPNVFRNTDVRLVRGPRISGTEEFEFYPMYKCNKN